MHPLVHAFMADWETWARETGYAVLIIAPLARARAIEGMT